MPTPPRRRTFLRAEWRKLVMANYPVDAALLRPYLPAGLELDEWRGQTYMSLVGFMFLNTQVLGLRVPGHVHFEEINLRFYVRRAMPDGTRRGVIFIQEAVPKPAIAWVANTLYRERYVTYPTRHQWLADETSLKVLYQWRVAGQWHELSATASARPQPMRPGSEEEFIFEHYWGYSGGAGGKTVEYEVVHPRWETYPVNYYRIEGDFRRQYGEALGSVLMDQPPSSVLLAEGSEISVLRGGNF